MFLVTKGHSQLARCKAPGEGIVENLVRRRMLFSALSYPGRKEMPLVKSNE